MRRQRQQQNTKKVLVNGYEVSKIGRKGTYSVRIDGKNISGSLSKCTSAALQAEGVE